MGCDIKGILNIVHTCHEIVNRGEPDEELSIFHLGGIMSGQGEKDFDLCLRVNLDGTRKSLIN